MTEDGKEQSTTFRRELLTKCQREFEKDKKDDEEKEKMQQAIDEAETVCLCVHVQVLLYNFTVCLVRIHSLSSSVPPPLARVEARA